MIPELFFLSETSVWQTALDEWRFLGNESSVFETARVGKDICNCGKDD